MSTLKISEAGTVQFPMVKHAAEIGWTTISPEEARNKRGGEAGKFFRDVLEVKLAAFNPWLSNDAVRSVVETLDALPATIEGNRELLAWFRGEHQWYDEAEKRHRPVTLVDYEHVTDNDFHVTWEWKIKPPARKANRADVMIAQPRLFQLAGVAVAVDGGARVGHLMILQHASAALAQAGIGQRVQALGLGLRLDTGDRRIRCALGGGYRRLGHWCVAAGWLDRDLGAPCARRLLHHGTSAGVGAFVDLGSRRQRACKGHGKEDDQLHGFSWGGIIPASARARSRSPSTTVVHTAACCSYRASKSALPSRWQIKAAALNTRALWEACETDCAAPGW